MYIFHFTNSFTLPRLFTLSRYLRDKMDHAIFAYCQVIKNWMVGRPGNDARLVFDCLALSPGSLLTKPGDEGSLQYAKTEGEGLGDFMHE